MLSSGPGFRLPTVLLPRPGIDLARWAVIACDQHTAEPAYWQRVAEAVGDAPSTLHLIFPEAFLGDADAAPARIAAIQRTMQRYLDDGVFVEHAGAVLVQRRLPPALPVSSDFSSSAGPAISSHAVTGERIRRGLMLELDLACYDFGEGSTSLIRPTEGTIVERLAPRIAVREGAALELPHVLVLIDDPDDTVLGPLTNVPRSTKPLYATELMLGGGHVAGYAVDAAQGERIVRSLTALADPRRSSERYGAPAGSPPMLFAVGDGNHSLAAAKSLWQRIAAEAGPDHPSRWAVVEVQNIHDAALDFAPIHRLLLGVKRDVRAALAEAFGGRLSLLEVQSAAAMRAGVAERAAGATFGVIGPGPRWTVATVGDGVSPSLGTSRRGEPASSPPGTSKIDEAAAPPLGKPGSGESASPLAVATVQAFVDRFVAEGGASAIDYVHGDEVLERLAQPGGRLGLHLATVAKAELLRRVVREGPLPRKTFSMGEADEKRFYVEARRIR
ncbi:MAG: DUF1015 domain-containing protein [Rubrivivax sp.]